MADRSRPYCSINCTELPFLYELENILDFGRGLIDALRRHDYNVYEVNAPRSIPSDFLIKFLFISKDF